MSNLTTVAFMVTQADTCVAKAMKELNTQPNELEWAIVLGGVRMLLTEVFKEIHKHVEEQEGMDKQINKVKKDIKAGNKKKAVKDVNKLLKMDKKFDKKLDKCAKMSKKAKKR